MTEQRAHRPWWNRPGWPQLGQLRQAVSGRVHDEQNGSSTVPPRSGATSPQPAQRIHRCLQAKHQGWSVALEITHAAVRPQIAHVSDGARYALATQRPVVGADGDRSTSTALDAGFLVGGIGDQAVGAQRSPLLVAGRGLADRPAPGAGLGAGLGGAVAAQPLPVDSPVQVNDSTAAGAGRADDRARSGVAQACRSDAGPTWHRCFGAGAGEQLGPVLQRPGKLMTVPGPGGRQPHRCGGDVGRQCRVGGD